MLKIIGLHVMVLKRWNQNKINNVVNNLVNLNPTFTFHIHAKWRWGILLHFVFYNLKTILHCDWIPCNTYIANMFKVMFCCINATNFFGLSASIETLIKEFPKVNQTNESFQGDVHNEWPKITKKISNGLKWEGGMYVKLRNDPWVMLWMLVH